MARAGPKPCLGRSPGHRSSQGRAKRPKQTSVALAAGIAKALAKALTQALERVLRDRAFERSGQDKVVLKALAR